MSRCEAVGDRHGLDLAGVRLRDTPFDAGGEVDVLTNRGQ